jgi:hypothetical protein
MFPPPAPGYARLIAISDPEEVIPHRCPDRDSTKGCGQKSRLHAEAERRSTQPIGEKGRGDPCPSAGQHPEVIRLAGAACCRHCGRSRCYRGREDRRHRRAPAESDRGSPADLTPAAPSGDKSPQGGAARDARSPWCCPDPEATGRPDAPAVEAEPPRRRAASEVHPGWARASGRRCPGGRRRIGAPRQVGRQKHRLTSRRRPRGHGGRGASERTNRHNGRRRDE